MNDLLVGIRLAHVPWALLHQSYPDEGQEVTHREIGGVGVVRQASRHTGLVRVGWEIRPRVTSGGVHLSVYPVGDLVWGPCVALSLAAVDGCASMSPRGLRGRLVELGRLVAGLGRSAGARLVLPLLDAADVARARARRRRLGYGAGRGTCRCGPGFCAQDQSFGHFGVCSKPHEHPAGPDCPHCGAPHCSDRGCWSCSTTEGPEPTEGARARAYEALRRSLDPTRPLPSPCAPLDTGDDGTKGEILCGASSAEWCQVCGWPGITPWRTL